MNCCGLNQLVVIFSVAIIKKSTGPPQGLNSKAHKIPDTTQISSGKLFSDWRMLMPYNRYYALSSSPFREPVPIQLRINFTPVACMLFDQIKNYLVDTAGVDPQKFENPELKVSDLELDSLGLIEMLFEIEDKYGFQIPDPMVFLPMTFAEMVAAIDVMVQEHARSQAAKN